MIKNKRITQIIFDAVSELNDELPKKMRLKKSVDTVLFGKSGKLDSMRLVTLIVIIEQKIEDVMHSLYFTLNSYTILYKEAQH